jgi:hypothetical protein
MGFGSDSGCLDVFFIRTENKEMEQLHGWQLMQMREENQALEVLTQHND